MDRVDIKYLLESRYRFFTSAERTIADFFLKNKEKTDLASRYIAGKLYVSEASLSRFAQKCGFKGYREFAYEYERYLEEGTKFSKIHELTKKVLETYQRLLDRSFDLVDEEQMRTIASYLSESRCVYVYGMGSSGIAAREMKLRFMRTGLLVEAITDSHMIKMNSALVDQSMLVVAISLSGKTPEILAGIKLAKANGARVILITASKEEFEDADQILRVAAIQDLSKGMNISPQFPILVMVDIFYSYYFDEDETDRLQNHSLTMNALGDPEGNTEQ